MILKVGIYYQYYGSGYVEEKEVKILKQESKGERYGSYMHACIIETRLAEPEYICKHPLCQFCSLFLYLHGL